MRHGMPEREMNDNLNFWAMTHFFLSCRVTVANVTEYISRSGADIFVISSQNELR